MRKGAVGIRTDGPFSIALGTRGPFIREPAILIDVDGKSKILIGGFLLLLLVTSAWKYKVYVLDRDFLITDTIPCDPRTKSCFVHECINSDECASEPYQKITIQANELPVCDKFRENECPIPTCKLGSTTCSISYCSENTLEAGETCYVVAESELPDSVSSEERDSVQ